MKKSKSLLYACSSTFFFWLGFTPNGFFPALLVCLIPVLRLLESLQDEKARIRFFWLYLTFAGWFLSTVWWVSNAHPIGLIAPTFIMGALYAWMVNLSTRMIKASPVRFFLTFLVLFLGIEKLFYTWDLEFPWLTLGNGLSEWPQLIQWYSITGPAGGSLWIISLNFGIWHLLKLPKEKRKPLFVGISLLLFIPSLASLYQYAYWKKAGMEGPTARVRVVQPNFDPYSAKFESSQFRDQLDTVCQTILQPQDSKRIDLVVLPETSIPGDIETEDPRQNWQYPVLDSCLKKLGNPWLAAGVNAYHFYKPGETIPHSARPYAGTQQYYDVFNAAMFRKEGRSLPFYTKSKLVVGVEKLPYSRYLRFLMQYALDLGGVSGELGQKPTTSPIACGSIQINPIICYESVFPEFLAASEKRGANLIAIMTNDGWWGNTPGYHQHFQFARMRAIETRRWVARSANTGISGFITPAGDVVEQLGWGIRGSLTQDVHLLEGNTFFTQFGDLLGWAAFYLMLPVFVFLRFFKKK